MQHNTYLTDGGVRVRHASEKVDDAEALSALAERLDQRRGLLMVCGVERPGRYVRRTIAFADPPLMITARDRAVTIQALNRRGAVLLDAVAPVLDHPVRMQDTLSVMIESTTERFAEEARSRQPSVFSILRALAGLFGSAADPHLGLYGAFGYDLVFQFEPIPLEQERAADQRDLVLYLPDELLIAGPTGLVRHRYEFETATGSTLGLPRETAPAPYDPVAPGAMAASDHAPGDYEALVERARAAFGRGDLFEVVLGQLFAAPASDQPSVVFDRLARANPAPYGALMNLGDGEFLVSASPEMFVRVAGRRIETCPISGTVARGRDAQEDAAQIRTLLDSAKDEAELTMCTDVDRNDKARVCEPGSVRILGRRQIELYSRLIHTVDHVEGTLAAGYDALDGFLSHAWAVTVTGAPKRGAIRFIEAEERSPRRWYGGALGRMTFDGGLDTGLTLRTIRLKQGVGEVRAGATLLHDSDPAAEAAESRLKASAMLAALAAPPPVVAPGRRHQPGQNRRILLIDHEDSFVHSLAGYFRTTGAQVTTLRPDLAFRALQGGERPDLVVLSAGPGRPGDFAMRDTIDLLARRRIPTFGVCLGLQGIVEAFGGSLAVLATPCHGKASTVTVRGGLFAGLPERFAVGRYHSLYADRETLPSCLTVTAETDDGVIMALEHATLPIAAVQFHPESLMTEAATIGLPMIEAVLETLCPAMPNRPLALAGA